MNLVMDDLKVLAYERVKKDMASLSINNSGYITTETYIEYMYGNDTRNLEHAYRLMVAREAERRGLDPLDERNYLPRIMWVALVEYVISNMEDEERWY